MAIAGDPVFRLPGMGGDEDVQHYRGDFFTIRLSEHAVECNNCICWLDGRVKDWNFIIEFDPDEIRAIPALQHGYHLNDLIPFFSISLEQSLFRLFTCELQGVLADRYMYARMVDVLLELSHLAASSNDKIFDGDMIRKAEQVKLFIDQDLSNYLTIGALAKIVLLSPSKLQAVFQYRYGMSVGRYSREVRMNAARDLLLTTNDLLLTIALAVGFNDTGNFCTSFKGFFGYTPTELRSNKAKSQQ